MRGEWQREASSVTVEHPSLIDHIITVPAANGAAAGFAPKPMDPSLFVGSHWEAHAITQRIQTRAARQKETTYMHGSARLHARVSTLPTRTRTCSAAANGAREDKQELDGTTPSWRPSLATWRRRDTSARYFCHRSREVSDAGNVATTTEAARASMRFGDVRLEGVRASWLWRCRGPSRPRCSPKRGVRDQW